MLYCIMYKLQNNNHKIESSYKMILYTYILKKGTTSPQLYTPPYHILFTLLLL